MFPGDGPVFVWASRLDFGGIKEGDAAFHCGTEKRGHLLLVFGRAVGPTHTHASEPDGRNFQAAVSQFALLHCFSFERFCVAKVESCRLSAITAVEIVSSTGRSVVRAGLGRLPISLKYLPDSPRLPRD